MRGEAGKRARRFLAAPSIYVIRVVPTPLPAHLCAWQMSSSPSVGAATTTGNEVRALSRGAERRQPASPSPGDTCRREWVGENLLRTFSHFIKLI